MQNANRDVSETLADLKEVAQQAVSGGIRDPDMLRRVRERAQQARAEVVQKLGIQEIGVQIIREMRDAG
jgi:predicted thioredoxin/glutaredoxin